MPSALRELIKALSGSREGEFPSSQSFPPLDLEQVSKELRIDERGKENGSCNLPPSAGDIEDTAESDIVAEIERRARKAREEYRSQLELYEGRIRNAANQTGHEANINVAGENAIVDFKVHAKDDLDFLYNAHDEAQGRESEFEAFRKKHRLERLPHPISSRERLIRALILAIFIIIESAFNGNFFMTASAQGFFGGFIQAFVFSLLNVGGAAIFALYVFPLLSHNRRYIKILGLLCIFVYLGWALGLNMLIGHFRDLFGQEAGGVVKLAAVISRLKSAPFGFSEVKTLILVLLGIGLSLVSFIDASRMKDPYLGYGAIGERRTAALTAYVEKKAQCFAELTKLRDMATEEMLSIIELIRSAENERHRALNGRSRLHENYCAYLRHLGDSYIRLLQRYREENMRSRSEPAPPRFSSRPLLPLFLTEPQLSALTDLSEGTGSRCIERMKYFIKAINQQFEAAIEKYESISSLASPEAKSIGKT